MSFKKTIVFLIVFVLLGGYYLIQGKRVEKQHLQEAAAKKLFEATTADIDEITLKRADEEIVVKKQGDVWRMIKPVEAAADAAAVEGILAELVQVERESTIAEDASQDEEFGLKTPELLLIATKKESGETLKLAFGLQTPISTGFYARSGDDSQVILVNTSVKTGLDKSLFDLRDKTILDFDPQQIKTATFSLNTPETGENVTIELQQRDLAWTMTAPKEYKADSTQVNSILSNVKSSNIQEFVTEDDQDLAQYGLDHPQATLSLTVGEENRQSTLLLGNADDANTNVYAAREGTPGVFLVPSAILNNFPKQVSDLRDKTLLSFMTTDVQSFELASSTDTIRLEQEAAEEEEHWKITQPESYDADASKVQQVLSDVAMLKVEQFVLDETSDLSLYGLEPPQLTVRIWENEQETPQTLLLGHADVENTGVYAKMADQNAIVLVKPDALDKLSKTASDLRNTKILTFTRSNVEGMKIEYADGLSFVLEKDGYDWKSKQPEEKSLALYKINNLLYDLESLEFTQKIVEPDIDLSVYGLQQPEVTITIAEKDNVILIIGTQRDGQDMRYVKTASDAAVYAIDPIFLDELPVHITDLVSE